jgi:hypothetical protein
MLSAPLVLQHEPRFGTHNRQRMKDVQDEVGEIPGQFLNFSKRIKGVEDEVGEIPGRFLNFSKYDSYLDDVIFTHDSDTDNM